MALRITQVGNNIVLAGNLNSNTAASLESHMNHLLNSNDKLNVNIGELDRIDMNGVNCLNTLKHSAHIAYKSIKVNSRKSMTVKSKSSFLTVA